MPRYGKAKHKTLPKNYLAVLSRPGALRPQAEQHLTFEKIDAAITVASMHLVKFADDDPDAEIFDITGKERVKVWP